MAELARLQARFVAGLLDPDAVVPALFRGDPRRAARCFAFYRGNLTANWDKGLGAAYPVIRQLVGDDFFRALARAFGCSRPSVTGDLNRFGEGFADFLTTFAPLSDYLYMADVARLEWSLHRAHYAAERTALDPGSLVALGAGAIESLRLHLRPGHVLFHSPWDAVGIWQAHQPGSAPLTGDVDRPSRCIVHRPKRRAALLPVTPGEFVALLLIDGGAALGEALESAVEADPGFDPGVTFPRWVEAGIFASYKPAEQDGET